MSNDYKVLIVDYEPRGILQLQGPLEKAGFSTVVAKDGLTGIEAFHRIKPHLTLIEAMLPKKHGFDVCEELKKTPHGRASVVIIVTSVYKGRKYRTQALHKYGCDEYLEKPVDPDRLVEIATRLVLAKCGVAAPAQGTAAASPDAGVADRQPQATRAPTRVDETEQEISDHLDDVLGSGPARGVSTDKVVSFDPDRSRKRRTENALTSVASGGSSSLGGVAAGHALDTLEPEIRKATPVPDSGLVIPEPRLEESLPRLDAYDPTRRMSRSGPWFWIALVFVLIATFAVGWIAGH